MSVRSKLTAPFISENLYEGKWYEAARTESSQYHWQEGCSTSMAMYKIYSDGIHVKNTCVRPDKSKYSYEGFATRTDQDGVYKLKFDDFPGVSKYIIHYIDHAYDYAVVGNGKDMAWVLCRKPITQRTKAKRDGLIEYACQLGYKNAWIIA